jgi:hypothetical protein
VLVTETEIARTGQRARKTLELHWSTALNHDDVLRDIEPFYRPLAAYRKHRLVQLVEAVRADRDAVREQRATTHLAELVELRHVASTFRAWANHSIGKKIVTDIRDSNEYAHNVVVLTALRFLHNWGNAAIELVEEDPLLHTPDLRVIIGSDSVGTEVKVPDEMRDGRALTPEEADAVADDAIRSSKKQRQGQPSFVLLVGGYQVPSSSLVFVASALERHLGKSQNRTNMAGAIALTVGRHVGDIPLTVERDTPPKSIWEALGARLNPAMFQMGVASQNAHNAKYAGPVRVLRFGEPGIGLVLP